MNQRGIATTAPFKGGFLYPEDNQSKDLDPTKILLIHPSLILKVRKNAYGQEISHPRDNNRKVDQRPEPIPQTDEHDRDHRLEQHRVEGGLEPGVKCSKEGR